MRQIFICQQASIIVPYPQDLHHHTSFYDSGKRIHGFASQHTQLLQDDREHIFAVRETYPYQSLQLPFPKAYVANLNLSSQILLSDISSTPNLLSKSPLHHLKCLLYHQHRQLRHDLFILIFSKHRMVWMTFFVSILNHSFKLTIKPYFWRLL